MESKRQQTPNGNERGSLVWPLGMWAAHVAVTLGFAELWLSHPPANQANFHPLNLFNNPFILQ